ncbi:MAG: helix-turn-helix transcriptional regulator [Nitrobacter sp.]|jgi:prophage regulatory protein
MASRLLRLPAVRERTGISTTEIYAGIKAGTFPVAVLIGKRSRAWVESEIEDWIAARIAERDSGGAPVTKPGGPGRGRKGSRATAEAAV